MSLKLDLSGRVALVTGGSRGIGKAIAITLGQAGARVMIAASTRSKTLEGVVDTITQAGGSAKAVAGDLGHGETPAQYIEACSSAWGQLDILVNNAGIWEDAPLDTLSADALQQTLRVNLESVFLLCHHALPLLRRSPSGRIVNVSSTASLLGEPDHAPYAASKGGMDALTRSLAVELGKHRITVNSVAPGWTRTDMTTADLDSELGTKLLGEIPLGKVAEVEDVAWAVAYLASDWAGHVSGITLPVEGAYRIRR